MSNFVDIFNLFNVRKVTFTEGWKGGKSMNRYDLIFALIEMLLSEKDKNDQSSQDKSNDKD